MTKTEMLMAKSMGAGRSLKRQEKIGHWIFIHPLQENDSGAYICSECKTGDWDINLVEDKECKFCGARMEGEVNG